MSDAELDKIWEDDRLGRRDEAGSVERFLDAEVARHENAPQGSSFVLGIDAAYGEGKSHFLNRLRRQLQLNHPVAFVDAWADDAVGEPLTAFMAAIEEALKPYMATGARLRARMARVKASALPVMGKLVVGALNKGLRKFAGDEIDEILGDTVEQAVKEIRAEQDEQGLAATTLDGALEQVGKEIEVLVDRRGAAMLEAYRQRKSSVAAFRQNMGHLVEAINTIEAGGQKPLYVIIDELDRCRPDYAIRVLEEIKHFFDVPGVAFIIALHGHQLRHSIAAVYGPTFDADGYLRRFFTRRYSLRRLSLEEIVRQEWHAANLGSAKFAFPIVNRLGSAEKLDAPGIIAAFLDECQIPPRDAFEIMDRFRLFVDLWDQVIEIELLLLLHLLAGDDGRKFGSERKAEIVLPSDEGGGRADRVSFLDFVRAYGLIERDLSSLGSSHNGANGWVAERMTLEISAIHHGQWKSGNPPSSVMKRYPDYLEAIARFAD